MQNFTHSILKSDIFSNLISFRYLPRWAILILDIVASGVAILLAIYISTNLIHKNYEPVMIPIAQIALVIGSQTFFFWLFRTYAGILRFSSYVDAAKLLFAIFSNAVFLLLINIFSKIAFGDYLFYNTTIIFYAISAFFLLFLMRLMVKTVFDFLSINSSNSIPVVIFGTQSAGITIAKTLRTNSNTNKCYRLVGFVDTDSDVTSKILMGVKVYPLSDENVKKYIVKKAKAVIVSPLKMEQINPKKDLDIFIENGLSVLTVPPIKVWENEMPAIRQIKSIEIEELLERPQIHISTDNISRVLKDRVVLISGAAGSIGSEIVRQSIAFNPKLIVILDQAETPMHDLVLRLKDKYPNQDFSVFIGDVRNKERMEYVMNTFRPDIIFHAAAYKHVPLMEDNPTESIQTNVVGTKNLADLAVKYNVDRFVMISTDKAVNPTNIMGASKRIAEIYVQSLNKKIQKEKDGKATKFITTRFGNVLGSNGSVIPLFKEQIEKGGPVTVTHRDIIRYFMTIPEASLLVLEAGTTGNGGEIFIFDMGEPVKIYDLAKKMIQLAGFKPDIDIPIHFTGLRQGEKLYEELFNKKELTIETNHKKIMVAKVLEYDFEQISSQIDELIQFSSYNKDFLCVSLMKAIVPEFISNNSQYERLDVDQDSKNKN